MSVSTIWLLVAGRQAGRQAGRFAVPFLRKSTHATAMRKCIPSAYHLFVRLCLRGRKGGWLL